MSHRVRRDRRRRPLRRLTDRDAAGPQGLPGAGRRPGDVPERHPVDARRSTRPASPRCAAGGCSTRSIATGCPPHRDVLVRLRPVHHRRHAAAVRRHLRRRTPRGGPCSTRSSSTRPRRPAPRCASASRSTRSSSRTATVVGIHGHDDDGASVIERARVVIGADGRNSSVARAVAPEQYHEKPMLQWAYYTYWRDLPVDGFETVIRPDRGWAAIPTNDGLTMLVVGWPYAEARAYKADVEGNYLRDARAGPGVRRPRAGRHPGGAVRRAGRCPTSSASRTARAGRWSATPATPRTRSPRRASATRSATPSCARRRSTTSFARRPLVRRRDGRLPADARRATCCRSTSSRRSWPRSSRRRRRCSSCSARCTATATRWTRSSSVIAGTVSPVEFFDPENIGRIMSAAAAG